MLKKMYSQTSSKQLPKKQILGLFSFVYKSWSYITIPKTKENKI